MTSVGKNIRHVQLPVNTSLMFTRLTMQL